MWRNQHLNASRDAWLASDETFAFECEDHLVDRRWSDAEALLHLSFGGRPPVHARVGVDEGQILALLWSAPLTVDRLQVGN